MKKDIPKWKTPFFFALKSLSNKQQLFFYFIGTLSFDVVNTYMPELNPAETVLGILILLVLFLSNLCIPTRIQKHPFVFPKAQALSGVIFYLFDSLKCQSIIPALSLIPGRETRHWAGDDWHLGYLFERQGSCHVSQGTKPGHVVLRSNNPTENCGLPNNSPLHDSGSLSRYCWAYDQVRGVV